MVRAWFGVGFSATLATAVPACAVLVPDLPAQPDAGIQDGASESAPGADAPNDVEAGDAPVGASDASEGDAPAGANDASDEGAPDADANARVPTFVQGNSFLSSPAVHTTLSATFTSPQT